MDINKKKGMYFLSTLIILIGQISDFAGFLQFINMLGIDNKNIINSIKMISNIVNFLTPFFVVWLVYYIIKIKDKIIALKTFRDKEMIRQFNHYNAQLKTFEDRIRLLNKKVGAYELENDNKEISPQLLLHESENNKQRIKEIEDYNDAFNDWGIGSYGLGENVSIYTKKNYKTD